MSSKNHHARRIHGRNQSKGGKNSRGAGNKGKPRGNAMGIQGSKQVADRGGKEHFFHKIDR